MSRHLRVLLVFAAASLCALLLAACGGSAPETAAQLITQTFSSSEPIHSGRVSGTVDLDLHGLSKFSGPISFQLSGPFQGDKPKGQLPDFDITLLLGAGGQSFSTGILATQGKGYMQFAGTSYVMTPALYKSFKQSYLGSSSKQGATGTLGAFGIHPSLWLIDPEKAGMAEVGGAKTDHLTASIDVPHFLADISSLLGDAGKLGVAKAGAPKSISPQAQAAIARSVTATRVDIFTGAADHTLRSLTLSVALVVAPKDRKVLGGVSGGTISVELLISGLNRKQTITPPANPQPLSNALSGVGGGSSTPSTGATGTPTTTTPSTSSPGITAPAPYLDCIRAAGENVAAIQKCAALLDG